MLWIGGAPDSGKSTAAEILARRHGLQVYHYDRRDLAHHERLAQTRPEYRRMLAAALDERWVHPGPQELFEGLLRSFRDRFPLVIEDLLNLAGQGGVLAEGFGLLPELLASIGVERSRAVFLVPDEAFKQESIARRGKPSFAAQVSDPERARANLLGRDRLLAGLIREQASACGFQVYEVDGSRSADETADRLEAHFGGSLEV